MSTAARQSTALSQLLTLNHPPVAIAFTDQVPPGLRPYDAAVPAPAADGRTGSVAASCVFWIEGQQGAFTTSARDHGNCSVGAVTHGFQSLAAVADNDDVAALLASKWVDAASIPAIPVITQGSEHISYGPLSTFPVQPDVVFLRLNAKQAMSVADAWPEVRFEGKPQCHILAIAKEHKQVAISVGCMLSRVRTGLPNTEMTCAIPGDQVDRLIEQLQAATEADRAVAAYAAQDKARFDSNAPGPAV